MLQIIATFRFYFDTAWQYYVVALQPWLVKWPPHYKLMYKVVCTCVQDEDMDDIRTAISKFPMEYAGDEMYTVSMEKSYASWDEQWTWWWVELIWVEVLDYKTQMRKLLLIKVNFETWATYTHNLLFRAEIIWWFDPLFVITTSSNCPILSWDLVGSRLTWSLMANC